VLIIAIQHEQTVAEKNLGRKRNAFRPHRHGGDGCELRQTVSVTINLELDGHIFFERSILADEGARSQIALRLIQIGIEGIFFVEGACFPRGNLLEYKRGLALVAPPAERADGVTEAGAWLYSSKLAPSKPRTSTKKVLKRNIEIKARVKDLEETRRVAQSLGPHQPEVVIHQEDIFFGVPAGRLKLRTINQTQRSELIFYQRANETGPKCSSYVLFPVRNPAMMRRRLDEAYGIRGIVRKCRMLLIVGITRIHLDEVEGLGNFVELEVVLPPEGFEQEGARTAREIMRQLNIDDTSLISGAYADLLALC